MDDRNTVKVGFTEEELSTMWFNNQECLASYPESLRNLIANKTLEKTHKEQSINILKGLVEQTIQAQIKIEKALKFKAKPKTTPPWSKQSK